MIQKAVESVMSQSNKTQNQEQSNVPVLVNEFFVRCNNLLTGRYTDKQVGVLF